MKMNAPILVIPDSYMSAENNPCLIMDLGNINIDSKIVAFDDEEDYKFINNPIQLYDAYNFELKELQIVAFDSLPDYKKYSTTPCIKIIKDVNLKIKAYKNIEPSHPKFPA